MKIICDWENCNEPGSYKAPIEKDNSKKYRLLCLKHIKIFNNGKMSRDFTFIDDIVEGVFRCCQKPATPEVNSKSLEISAPYRIFNIGNGIPIDLMDFIKHLEDKIGIKAQKEYKIEATPTIFINEKKYLGKIDYKQFKKAIEKNL